MNVQNDISRMVDEDVWISMTEILPVLNEQYPMILVDAPNSLEGNISVQSDITKIDLVDVPR